MTEPSDKTFARGETLHSACLCCEHAAARIRDLRQVIIGVLEGRKRSRPLTPEWAEAVEKLLTQHDPNRDDES